MSIASRLVADDQQTGSADVPALVPVDVSPQRLSELTAVLAEHAAQVDRDAAFPWAGLQAVHDAGILTATVSADWNGHGGLSNEQIVDVFLALGEGDPATALIAAMTVFQHAHAELWPEELYRRVLRESAERPTLINAIRAEPELGAPARGGLPATTVSRTSNGWVLNGRKGYATGSEGLAYHLVWAVTDEPVPTGVGGADRLIGHVIVPATSEDGTPTPGLRIERTWDHLGQRGTSTHDVVYTDVEVPESYFTGAP
ncbi:MAG: acyl-CoA dehydrogenase family protein, partial [Humibacter sp.]